tara:strand:+ start:413 stop:736 length:324 start_codon:yes stop_codon:yes gene_type:complete
MAKKKKDYNIVEVIWIDAEEHGEVGWNSTKEQLAYAKKPCPVMHTVGYEVYRGPDHISLLSTIGDKDCSSIEKIPLAFIKTINVLKNNDHDQVVTPGKTISSKRKKL